LLQDVPSAFGLGLEPPSSFSDSALAASLARLISSPFLRASSTLRFFSNSFSSSTLLSAFFPLGFASLAFGSLGISLGVSVSSGLIPESIGVALTTVSTGAVLTSIIGVGTTSCIFASTFGSLLVVTSTFSFFTLDSPLLLLDFCSFPFCGFDSTFSLLASKFTSTVSVDGSLPFSEGLADGGLGFVALGFGGCCCTFTANGPVVGTTPPLAAIASSRAFCFFFLYVFCELND